jgi:hypothetical protein
MYFQEAVFGAAIAVILSAATLGGWDCGRLICIPETTESAGWYLRHFKYAVTMASRPGFPSTSYVRQPGADRELLPWRQARQQYPQRKHRWARRESVSKTHKTNGGLMPRRTSSPVASEHPKKKRKLSAAGKRALVEATKKCWARVRARSGGGGQGPAGTGHQEGTSQDSAEDREEGSRKAQSENRHGAGCWSRGYRVGQIADGRLGCESICGACVER